MAALVAFSSGVTINSPGLVHHCKLHRSTKLMLCQASKTLARGAPHPASSADRRTTGRETAQINHRILILTRVGEHLLQRARLMGASSVVRLATGPVIAQPRIVVVVPVPAVPSRLLLWACGIVRDTDSKLL